MAAARRMASARPLARPPRRGRLLGRGLPAPAGPGGLGWSLLVRVGLGGPAGARSGLPAAAGLIVILRARRGPARSGARRSAGGCGPFGSGGIVRLLRRAATGAGGGQAGPPG